MEDRIVLDLTHLKDINEIVYQQIKLVAKKSKYCTLEELATLSSSMVELANVYIKANLQTYKVADTFTY